MLKKDQCSHFVGKDNIFEICKDVNGMKFRAARGGWGKGSISSFCVQSFFFNLINVEIPIIVTF